MAKQDAYFLQARHLCAFVWRGKHLNTRVNVVTLQCAAQEQLEEDLAKEGEEGDLNLDQNLLNEYSKLKETAMARASKPTRDCATQEAQLKASAPHTFCRL